MKNVSFTFSFDSKDEAEVIFESLEPEIKQKIPKTAVEMSKLNEKSFRLFIKAKDTSSLRAACNSFLRWIITALEVNKAV